MGADLAELLQRADDAAALVGQDPERARRLAAEVAVPARAAGAWEALAVAERARARAASSCGHEREALAAIRRAERAAVASRAPARLAEARLTASFLLLVAGKRRAAFERIDLADDAARTAGCPLLQTKVAVQRAVMLWRTGDAAAAIRRIEPLLGRVDGELRADVLVNMGGMLADVGRHGDAEVALQDAAKLYDDLGMAHDAAAVALHNLATLYAYWGRIPASLELFGDIEARLESLGVSTTWLSVGMVQVLLAANLIDEALDSATRAAERLDPATPRDLQGEVWWRLADARLRAGDPNGAAHAARTAARRFASLGNQARAGIARRLEVRARMAVAGASRTMLARAIEVAGILDRAGLEVDAMEAHLDVVVAAAALAADDVLAVEAGRAGDARRRGPSLLRARACLAQARANAALGRRPAALRAVRLGLRLLDDHRATLGSTELRALASGHGADLADLGLGLALGDRKAGAVLDWAEQWRAGVVWRHVAASGALGPDLVALRRVRVGREEAAAAGEDTTTWSRREQELESAIRRRSRLASGDGHRPSRAIDLAELRTGLGDRALIEVVEHQGHLHAVVVAGARVTLHSLGPAAAASEPLGALIFALRRLGRPPGAARSARATDAARVSAHDALGRLDEVLVGPLRRRLGERPALVVPTAALHAVPWPSLPSLDGRAVEVAPSSAWWLRRPEGARREGPVALVAGPGLHGAAAEVAQLAAQYPGSTVLTGAAATTEATARALEGALVAHLACHGRFRADNPQFSSLELADGPLTVYDLERLECAPALLVLAACDSGVSQARPGDELLGVVASLMALGSAAIVASVVPVPDLDTSPLMVRLHDGLRAGSDPAAALAAAASGIDVASPAGFVARTAFVCFGRSVAPRVPSGPWPTT